MLRVTLDKEALLNAGAIITKESRGINRDVRIQEVLHFGTLNIDLMTDGSVHLNNGSLAFALPKEVEPFVTEVSYYDNFGYGFHPTRRIGEYRLDGAVADLQAAGTSHYHLKLHAFGVAGLSALRELNQLIRQGQIWPAKDYEAKQVPPPCRHLRDLVKEAWQLIRRDVRDQLYRIQLRIQGRIGL